jgi:hypothetical protein
MTFIPNSSSSNEIDSESPSSANLLDTYAEMSGTPNLPTIELIFTIAPFRYFLIMGTIAFISLIVPKNSF